MRHLPLRAFRRHPRGSAERTFKPVFEALESRDAPAVFHVATTGADALGRGSQQLPFRSIQYAVNQSASGDAILVAGGTYNYNPATEIALPTLYLTGVVAVVNKQLTILGGFSTTNWVAPNYAANPTVIDGQNIVRGVYAIDVGAPASLRMEGFTIRNAVARGNANPGVTNDERIYAFGGGAFLDHAKGTLRDITFENNQAIGDDSSFGHGGAGSGAGLTIRNTPTGGIVTLERLTFRKNVARGGVGPERGGYGIGGGFFATDGANVVGNDITVEENVAIAGSTNGPGNTPQSRPDNEFFDGFGGGVAVGKGSAVTLSNLRVLHNQSIGGNAPNGNAGGGFGGGVFAEGTASQPLTLTIRDSDIRENFAHGGSGKNQDALTVPAGVALGGGVMTFNGNLSLERVNIVGNVAQGGDSSVLKGSGGGGGGAFLREGGFSTTTIANSYIVGNRALQGGGTDEQLGGGGGGLFFKGTEATLTHVTLADNAVGQTQIFGEGMQGVAFVALDFGSPTPTKVNVVNSIISGHTSTGGSVAVHMQPGNLTRFDRVLFSGNTKDTNADGKPKSGGLFQGLETTFTASSPGFVAPGANYHLAAGSAAIDRGGATSVGADFDNRLRVGLPDLGADELDSSQPVPSTVGVYDPASASWYLRNRNSSGGADFGPFPYGAPGWTPVVGDWNGDGSTNIGVFDPRTATWYLRNSNTQGGPDFVPFQYGAPGWIPVVGDWDGNGTTTIGVFDPASATWYLRNSNTGGGPDITPFPYGAPGWTPVVGDWDGNGTTSVGVYEPAAARWYLRNQNSQGGPSVGPAFPYGGPFWKPVVGDWDGNGTTTIGVFDPSSGNWYERNANSSGGPDTAPFAYGLGAWTPLGGRWSGRPGSPLLAQGVALNGPPSEEWLQTVELKLVADSLFDELERGGLGMDALRTLKLTQFVVDDLPGRMLGLTTPGLVFVDGNAAGRGWDVDASTPSTGGASGIDLRSVLLHEFGHVLGRDDSDAASGSGCITADTLGVGEIRTIQDLLFARSDVE